MRSFARPIGETSASQRLLNMLELLRGDESFFRRGIVEEPPDQGPDQARCAGQKEDPPPVKRDDDERNERRRNHGSYT